MLDLSSVATSLLDNLAKKGHVKLVRVTENYDPVTGVKTEMTIDVDLSAAELPAPTDLVDGERIKLTDKLFVIGAGTLPRLKDRIKVDSLEYSIISIEKINHAGTDQLYKVIARG